MRLTNFTDYSLRILIYLAVHPERLCTAKEVAEHFKISQNHMVKVAHNLSKTGYIDTQQGRNGGMSLSRTPEKINVGEIVRKLEPDFELVECFNCAKNTCTIAVVCKLKPTLFGAYKAFIDELGKYTLADITDNKDELLEIFGGSNAS